MKNVTNFFQFQVIKSQAIEDIMYDNNIYDIIFGDSFRGLRLISCNSLTVLFSMSFYLIE